VRANRATRLTAAARACAVLLLAMGLASCVSRGVEPDVGRAVAGLPSALPPGGAGGPRFGDYKPHAWDGVAPWHYPVHGIDVSKWQGPIDWPQVRASGVDFAFIKATEGGDLRDDRFGENWREARAAGVLRGAYHFYYFCRPAIEQARWFIANVPRERGALPPVLDMEWNHKSRNCPGRPPAETVRAEMQVWKQAITAFYGRRPIIYTTVDFYRDNELWRVSGYEFWLRSVAGHPEHVYAGQNWTFWQYTGTGQIGGVRGHTDINAFAGSRSAWNGWVRSRVQ
jgi:lysozyme